jgi:hypothetical protein
MIGQCSRLSRLRQWHWEGHGAGAQQGKCVQGVSNLSLKLITSLDKAVELYQPV